MTKDEKQKLKEQDIIEEMQEEIEEIDNEDDSIDEENTEDETVDKIDENSALAKVMADFDNFKKRTERDKEEMVFFLKQDIFKKILPRLDDLDRIILNTPEDLKNNALFEGIVSMQSKLLSDLEKLGVKSFESKGQEVNPDLHDVMTTVPGQKEGIIVDEFEKGFMLGDRVLRHAKVVAGAGD